MDPLSFLLGFSAGILAFGFLFLLFRLLLPLRRAMFHATGIGPMHIVGMLIRGHPPSLIVDTIIALRIRGHNEINVWSVESCYTANRHEVHDVETLVRLVEEQLQEAPDGTF